METIKLVAVTITLSLRSYFPAKNATAAFSAAMVAFN
jgi:hypothetical protein